MTISNDEGTMLSIVMPVKNTSLYLPACMKSIVNQSWKNWELLAINDHSTDDSEAILNSFAQADKRIKVVKNKGKGVIDALRTGFDISKGNFITRMDSDDINELIKFEYMIGQLTASGVGHIALGQVDYFAEGGIGDGFQNYETWMNGLIATGNCFTEIYKECVIPSPCWMLHRSDFESVGGFESSLYPEDYDLCFRMYEKGLKPIACDKVLFHWRDYADRTTRVVSHYQGEALLKLKCYHFISIDFDASKRLVLWGAGNRGKWIARYLVEHGIPFLWVCNNKNKIGHMIYHQVLKATSSLLDLDNMQIIISVANHDEQLEIKAICTLHLWESYFFC